MSTAFLSDEQFRLYTENGYLEYGRVLGHSEVHELRDIIEDLMAKHRPDVELTTTETETYSLFTLVFQKYPRFWELMQANPVLLDIIESILGPTFRLVEDQMFYKPANHGAPLLFHNDNVYYGFKDPKIVTCWIALDDATPENGCLRMLPGTHRQDTRHETVPGTILQEAVIDESLAITVPARTGELILFDGLTVHGSGSNTTDKPRRVANMVAIVPSEDGIHRKFDDKVNPYLRGKPDG
jgi:ectoine hydroxylase-related dioxygenase (phytanoyl-CoA dioxygenase family)